jgi:hypothetical protein
MSDVSSKIQIFGTRANAEACAIREFLHRCDVPFVWIELKGDRAICRCASQIPGILTVSNAATEGRNYGNGAV